MQSQAAKQVVELGPARTRPGGMGLRLRGLVLLVPCVSVIWIAHWLTPRKAGHGTHEELGLPPCSFLVRTGYPCPSCGLTTSFAAVVRGSLREALLAHPFGPVLFVGTAAVGLCALAELLFGRDFLRFLRPGAWWAVVALVGLLGGWGVKIACGLASGALPAR